MIKTFSKENLSIQHIQWIPSSSVPVIYNEFYQHTMSNLTSSKNKKNKKIVEHSKFECLLYKYNTNFQQKLDDKYVLLVLSRFYGLLMVDFKEEGIIQLEIGKMKDPITSFQVLMKDNSEIINAQNEADKQAGENLSDGVDDDNRLHEVTSLTCVGTRNGTVKFISSDSELEVTDFDDKSTYHSSNVSCIQFSNPDKDGTIKCATGSFDRYINLWKITNFGKASFDCKKDISLFTRMK